MDIVIENLKDYRKPILLESIFKEDTKVLYSECLWVMQDWLSPTSNSGTSAIFFGSHNNSNAELNQKLMEMFPKKNMAHVNRQMVRNSHMKVIFSIAKKHHVAMRWCGNDSVSCGDQWIISQNGKEIGILRI